MTNDIILFLGSFGFYRNNTMSHYRKMGFRIAVIGIREVDGIDFFINGNLNNESDVIYKALDFNNKNEVAAIISFMDNGVKLASILTNLLGLKGNSIKAGFLSRDKFMCKTLLKKNKFFSIPCFTLATDIKVVRTFIEECNNKYSIIKPIIGSGGKGVIKLNSKEIDETDFTFLNSDKFMIEEFIVSDFEISVEVCVSNNQFDILGVHDKKTTIQEPFLEEYLILDSPRIDKTLTRAIENSIRIIIEGMNFVNGGMHVEFLVKNNKLFLIEVNGRIGGGFIAETIYYKKNINVIDNIIRNYIGLPIKKTLRKTDGYFGFRSIYGKMTGEITNIIGLDELRQRDDVVIVRERLKVGDKINDIASDYVLFILMKNTKFDKLQENLEDLKLEITIDRGINV